VSMLGLVLLLVVGGIAAAVSERLNDNLPRFVSLGILLAALLLVLSWLGADPGGAGAFDPQGPWWLYLKLPWIERFGISLELGLDGLSLVLLLLTLLLGIVAVLSSWTEIDFRPGLFQANLLWTLAGVCGVFLALDLFLFFLFWEVMLVPMYLLIAIWGHEKRAYAAMKFFLFTQFSGLLMLLAIVVLAWNAAVLTGAPTFSYRELLEVPLGPTMAWLTMLGFFAAFAVKLPAFPFHTWLPDAHTQAPTAGSVLLAGILLKTGAYGLLRFCLPLFPDTSADFAPIAMTLGLLGVFYGAVLAFAQRDVKRLVAYSSVSHMGFVLLGLYAWNALAVQGAIMQMVAHGVSTAALFMLAGALQQRLHTRDMDRMGGLWQQAPRMGACALIFALASLGLPGLGNFIAEFLVLAGLFASYPLFAAAAALGLVTAAVYSLWLVQRTFQGAPDPSRTMADFGTRELGTMVAMVLALLWLGLNPQPVLDLTAPVLNGFHEMVASAGDTGTVTEITP